MSAYLSSFPLPCHLLRVIFPHPSGPIPPLMGDIFIHCPLHISQYLINSKCCKILHGIKQFTHSIEHFCIFTHFPPNPYSTYPWLPPQPILSKDQPLSYFNLTSIFLPSSQSRSKLLFFTLWLDNHLYVSIIDFYSSFPLPRPHF